ncbi:Tyrosine-protein phosphatase 69D [Aphelenchoides besseyi]|nr:Tyrosine-protein phosphatase 69D [Aphelenchoides besseyi]
MSFTEFHDREILLLSDGPNPYFRGLFGRWNRMIVSRRMRDYENKNATVFVEQMVGRITSILIEIEKRHQMIDYLFHDGELKSHVQERDELESLVECYGERMGSWLDEIYFTHPKGQVTVNDIRMSLCKQTSESDSPIALAAALERNDNVDELETWFCPMNGNAHRTMERIQGFAAFMCSMLRFSFLLNSKSSKTSSTTCNSKKKETAQTTFDSNYLLKARNKNVVCGELNRVVLTRLDGFSTSADATNATLLSDVRVFDDIDCPDETVRDDYGTGDFIHANRIFGGPLKNQFILTQAPMPHTIVDFWRMVWQEKSKFVFMLCSFIDVHSLALLGSAKPNGCPRYWPKPNETVEYGPFVIRNDSLDMTIDPLFDVSTLSIWLAHDPTVVHVVEHWQWDWTEFDDFRWPLRLLRRSRIESSPTIVHCLDGCGRSGTLVLIETMLMQLLRGTNNFTNPMLTSGVFLRLQRRHAVANSLQYLFAYRCVLHWCQPYVLSSYNRLLLGFYFNNSGFCGKYEEIAASYTRKGKLRV